MNRQEAQELLPWYVAGALSSEEMRAVRAFIENGEISRSELDQMAFLAEATGESGAEEPRYDPRILQQVLEGLDDVEQLPGERHQRPLGEPVVVVRERRPSRIGSWFSSLLEQAQWSLTPPLAKAAIGAQFVLLMVLAVAFSVGEDAEAPGYEVVSGSVNGDYTLTFAPGATERQVRALLLENRASIVAGPSAIGLYTIDVDDDVDGDDAAARLQASDLVTFIQRAPKP